MLDRLKRLVNERPGTHRFGVGADGDALVFECQNCRSTYEAQRQECSECGGYHIERAEW